MKEARVSSQFDAVGLGVKNRHEQKSHGSICGKCKHERSHPQSTSQVGFAYSLNYLQYIMSQVCQCSRQCCTNTSGHHYESIMYTKWNRKMAGEELAVWRSRRNQIIKSSLLLCQFFFLMFFFLNHLTLWLMAEKWAFNYINDLAQWALSWHFGPFILTLSTLCHLERTPFSGLNAFRLSKFLKNCWKLLTLRSARMLYILLHAWADQ